MMALSLSLSWMIVLIILPLCKCLDQASFYGNSFISIPLKEAKGYTDIRFKFRTHLSDALILLVAGSTDYCILKLDNARLKLDINLGSGEFEITSPQGVKLNDLEWHEVSVTRREANLTLVIDNLHSVKKRLPGKFFELNVHYGLFVGGHGNFSDVFFGHQENFRGCLADLMYNGISVLERARHRQTQTTIVRGITWNCATEFDADSSQPMSFLNDGAYLTVVTPPMLDFMTWQVELKTLSEKSAIILYNTGLPLKMDTFSLELWKGKVRLLLKLGENKIMDGINDVFVADGQWHKVLIRVASPIVELIVDSLAKSLKISKSIGYSWEASDVLYVGGVDMNKRSKSIAKGFKMPDGSFKGCMQFLKIGDKHVGLRDARTTEGLLNGCVWQFPCLTKNPCSNDGMCIQQSLDSYSCLCKSDTCSNSSNVKNDKVISRGSLATDLELLILQPLQVVEGQSILITAVNLHVVLDYPKYGVSESGVIFHIIEAPEHGSVVIDVWPHEKNSFTLSDISRDKVYYVHDGSEHLQDRVIMEVEFSAADVFILPVYVQGRFRLTLLANITPTNDPPILNIPSTAVLRLARGMKGVINREILHANDPDSSSKELVYSVVDSGSGHVEHTRKSGVPISSFTQQEIDNDQIVFVHHATADDDSYLSLRVSDGIETSKVSKLRVSAFPQYWRIHNNTGLVVMHETSTVITGFNLSFISNVPGSIDEAQYYIIQEPQFGVLETEINTDVWKKAVTFTSEDLRRHRVRYRHTTSRPNYDEFQFRTTLNGSAVYTFRITFKKCDLIKAVGHVLQLYQIQQGFITVEQLQYKTEPIAASATSIQFVITRVPQYGYLFLFDSKYRIGVGDSFTQEDIVASNINYRLYHKSYSHILDGFFYIVMTRGCKNITGNVSIEYFPSEDMLAKVRTVLEPLQVEEGAEANIAPTHLNLLSSVVTELQFNVTQGPSYGFLQVKDDGLIRNQTTFFTLHELVSHQLFYIHDNSESRHDSFHFVALSKSEKEDFQYAEVFNINIQLKNDNSPVRVVEKVFHVVVNGQKLLTGNDLKYSDADLDTSLSNIIYTCRELPNGEIYSFKNTSIKVTEFSQQDLNDGLLLFKHHGPKHSKIKLWITDGQFYVDGILEVQASAPFVRISNNRKLITQHGKWAVISNQHLSVETNIFAFDNDILYEIITKPVYGKIVTSRSLQEVTNFTQTQVNGGQVFYIHEEHGNSISADQASLRIRCKDAVNVTQLNIWMLPASYWDPLIVKSSCTLIVEESTSAVIEKSILEVSQADNVPAGAIVYSVAEYPQNGYLSIVPLSETDTNESLSVSTFTQALINENRLVYVQSKSNETRDTIMFNVTNSMVWLYGLFLEIKIIPEHLYLGSNGLTVNEGETATFTEAQLFIRTEYYKSRVIEYIILQQPLYGWIESQERNNKLSDFTHEELITGAVRYTHDNSENLHDEIVIVAVADTKRSLPVLIEVNIIPVNDQKPQLINNTGLKMWEGGVSVITNNMLAAVDSDHPPDTLRYQVLGCWWGNVSLISEPSTSLRFFTQELINKGVVVFRHQNGTDAKFTFNISDGAHSTEQYSFSIKTKPVLVELLENSILHVFPLQKKQLTTKNLLASISDPDRSIHFKITSSPMLGRLLTRSDMKDIFQVTNKFTQADINDGKVFYEHTHPFENLYADDTFIFNVVSHLAQPLLDQKFKIDISVSSGGLDAYVSIPKVTVEEGGITNIKLNLSGVISFLENHAGLKSPIIHASIIMSSKYGQVFLQQSPNLTTFTQQQLESGQVYYQHDHSDSLEDHVYLSLYLLPGYIILCNVTLPIEIIPINDQPFKLITPAPHFAVVQGENHTIKATELATEDADTPPEDIHYNIIFGPSEGHFVLLPEAISVTDFSQKDINMGRLIYVHDGFSLTDVFHLRVWDGKFGHDYTVLNIQVIPVSLNISIGLPLYLQQGSNVVLLSHKQFVIETNADVNKIRYIVKEGPRHGLLYVKDAPATTFGQIELDNDDVMYMQTDMTTANDSIKIFTNLIAGNTSVGEQVEIVIKVQPLMQIRNFTAVSGTSNRLSINVLDATPLAKLTNSNPHYTIIRSPRYGQIRKIIRSSGETRNVLDSPVNSFTHEEVQSGLIYLVTKNVDVGWDGIRDELHFILAATIFQPAMGKLKIIVKSTLHGDIYSTLASPSDPAGREGGMHVASPHITRDYFLIVSMVVGVIVLGVMVIVIIKCRALEPDLNKEEQSLQPIPLPRPPETLMATPSPIKQHVHDGFASPIPVALPQCKVTPLSETHTRYPYGIEEHLDDWSSCDASDPSCPTRNNVMLRRNQYWV